MDMLHVAIVKNYLRACLQSCNCFNISNEIIIIRIHVRALGNNQLDIIVLAVNNYMLCVGSYMHRPLQTPFFWELL